MSNLEQRVVSFLLNQDFDNLKTYRPYLKKLKWSDRHQPIIDLLNDYISEADPSYGFSSLVISQYKDKSHLATLLSEDLIPTPVGKKEIKQLINQQAQESIAIELNALKGRPAGEVLKRIKEIKAPLPTKPYTLTEARLEKIEDWKLEKVAPSTGYPELDDIIQGFVPGRVYLLTGETNIGKTQTCCNFAFNVAQQQGRKVLYFSLEPGFNIVSYLASIWSNKAFSTLTEQDLIPLVDIDIYIKDQVPNLEAMVQIIEDSDRYDLIIVDHFGYFVTNENKNQQESNALKTINTLAKRKKSSVLLVVHPRKPQTQSKKRTHMTMNDISGSAAFKQDATEVLILVREPDDTDQFGIAYTNNGCILVPKTKSGSGGVVQIKFIPNTGKIVQKSSAINQHIYDTSP